MESDLLRRAGDLDRRCTRTASVTSTAFLTPAEAAAVSRWADRGAENRLLLHGGVPGAERRAAFFLPDWLEEDAFDPAEHLRAVACTARFGAPGHRDFLGAILGLGVERDRIGDILVSGETAHILCLPTVEPFLLLNLEKVGRWGVRARAVPLSAVPAPQRETEPLRFTVAAPRLDAVCAGAFRISRTKALEAIAAGLVSRNYEPCLKPDALCAAGDVLSLRGRGKCELTSLGAEQTRKGRLFVTAEVYK